MSQQLVHNRQETLRALACLGVVLPPHTKLSDDALDKRRRQALVATQPLSQVLSSSDTKSSPLLNFSSFSAWPSNGTPVHEVSSRLSLQETGLSAKGLNPGLAPLRLDPFNDLRQTVIRIAKAWDDGYRYCVVQDMQQSEAERVPIHIRILEVRKVDDRTPLILMLYGPVTSSTSTYATAPRRWIDERVKELPKLPNGQVQMPNIFASFEEQKLLSKLLAQNSKLVPAEYVESFKRSRLEQDHYKATFLLPLGPLSFEDIGKLNSDTGYVVCGEKTASRCSQCQSASYCGSSCQKLDWPSHKRTCRSLKGGTWLPLRTRFMPDLGLGDSNGKQMYMSTLNCMALPSEALADHNVREYDPKTASPPPNVHSDKIFLVKMQPSLGPKPASLRPHMLIYDRQKSFQMYATKNEENSEVYKRFEEEVKGPRGGYRGLKMYRWAERTGDWELSVCLDKEPQEAIQW